MAERSNVYFVSDVHLGLRTGDPAEREARFVRFLRDIPRDTTRAVYLLGDIWDFWYEYRDVVPREATRVVVEFCNLMDAGVELYYCSGNHDVWTFSYFESLGMHMIEQPYFVEIGGLNFCLGHGDRLGGGRFVYNLMMGLFHNRVAQRLFSMLHPWIAFRFGLGWSRSSRHSHAPYRFRNEEEPLYQYALRVSQERKVDVFVFGHYHDSVDLQLPTGARFVILKDWMDGGCPCAVLSASSFGLR